MVSSHEKRVLWPYMYIVVLWWMKDQIRNQDVWEKMKPIKVQLRALTCISDQKNGRMFFVFPTRNRFSCDFFGIALAFINEMHCQESFVSFCLQCMTCYNLDPKIYFDAGFWAWQTRLLTIYGQYYQGSKIRLETKSYWRNWNISRLWAVHFKCMTWNNLKYSRSWGRSHDTGNIMSSMKSQWKFTFLSFFSLF